MITELENTILKNRSDLHPVVNFDPACDKLLLFDFTDNNTELTADMIADTEMFSAYVNQQLNDSGARYGVGGYNENRKLYRRSNLFEGGEARSIHLGVDVWGLAGTPIYAALDGRVHSFANNDHFGDYGATIILTHELGPFRFHTLYGHLSLADIEQLHEGQLIKRGESFSHFGPPAENGNWPPHLHFQIIVDMQGKKGDYPGVCKPSESQAFLTNCPDADLILDMMRYA